MKRMGRPPVENPMVQYSASMSPFLLKKIERMAADKGITRSAQLKELVEKALKED